MNMSSLKYSRGFTLIEVLVALGIAVVVIFSAYSLYFSISRGTVSIYEKMKNREKAYNFLTMLRKEVESIYYFKDVDYTGLKVEENDYYGKPASTLTFTSYFKDGIKVITYYVKEESGVLNLVKSIQDKTQNNTPVKFNFMKNIDGFSVRILDEGYDKVFDSGKLKKLPRYIKVSLVMKEGDKSEEYSQICSIMTGN